jgi:phosphoribosylformylglycinamidine synthase
MATDEPPFQRVVVPLPNDDPALLNVSERGGLSLSLVEMQTIRAHFRELGRDPTDVELETLAQTWSEHCKHKTLAGRIEIEGILELLGFSEQTYTRLCDVSLEPP